MKLLTYSFDNVTRPGVIVHDRVIDLAAAGLGVGADGDLLEIIRGGAAALEKVAEITLRDGAPARALDTVSLMAPVLRPSKIIGIGLNYVDHCKEANLKVPKAPILFAKFQNTVTGHGSDITWSRDLTSEVDYEVELGIVIGKAGRDIPLASAREHVLGYTVVNDVTARDLQFGDDGGQWDRGKSLDTFCPYGPWIVTRDEIPDPDNLRLQCFVNGKQMQNANTSNMIFNVDQLVSFVSRNITLMPGDLIATGTPFGVGFSRKPPVYLQHGDVCTCEVEGIGSLTNRVRTTA